jgi:hypothetical protein
MDIKQIRTLLREGSQVVLIEEGQPPLIVRELRTEEPATEIQITSRWPKGRSISEGPSAAPREPQDQILERLNKEILALRDQITQDEAGAGEKAGGIDR